MEVYGRDHSAFSMSLIVGPEYDEHSAMLDAEASGNGSLHGAAAGAPPEEAVIAEELPYELLVELAGPNASLVVGGGGGGVVSPQHISHLLFLDEEPTLVEGLIGRPYITRGSQVEMEKRVGLWSLRTGVLNWNLHSAEKSTSTDEEKSHAGKNVS